MLVTTRYADGVYGCDYIKIYFDGHPVAFSGRLMNSDLKPSSLPVNRSQLIFF